MACARGWLCTVQQSQVDRGTNQHDSPPALVRTLGFSGPRTFRPGDSSRRLLASLFAVEIALRNPPTAFASFRQIERKHMYVSRTDCVLQLSVSELLSLLR
jgi:hypothetical protein